MKTVAKLNQEGYKKMDFYHAHIEQGFGGISTCPEQHFLVVRHSDQLKNLIDSRGNFLLDEWYPSICIDAARKFKEYVYGFGRIIRADGKENIVREDGKILFKDWVNDVSMFNYKGIARLLRIDDNGGYFYNFADMSGKYLLDSWVEENRVEYIEEEYGF